MAVYARERDLGPQDLVLRSIHLTGRGAPTPSRRATHSSSHGHHKRSTRDPPGRTGRRLDEGAGGGWQEQGFGVTASLTRSRGERPWEAMGTTSIARIGKESSTTTGTLKVGAAGEAPAENLQ